MAGRNPNQQYFFIGLGVLTGMTALVVVLFDFAIGDPWGSAVVPMHADFKRISGLGESSSVFLAGKKVGRISEINFVHQSYPCDPSTEDRGGRGEVTNACDSTVFCAPQPEGGGLCAEFLAFTGKEEDYRICQSDADCGASRACITDDLLTRFPHLRWGGRTGLCAEYGVELSRIRVSMEISDEMAPYLRSDGLVSVVSDGVLGEQLIDISVGEGAPLSPGSRMPVALSLLEELTSLKQRFDRMTYSLERNLDELAELWPALKHKGEPREVEAEMRELNLFLEEVRRGEGEWGPYFADPELRQKFLAELAGARKTMGEIGGELDSVQRDAPKQLEDISQAAGKFADRLEQLGEPGKEELWAQMIYDDEFGTKTAQTLHELPERAMEARDRLLALEKTVAELHHSLQEVEGRFGELIKDPAMYDELVDIFGNTSRNQVLKDLSRKLLERQDEQ